MVLVWQRAVSDRPLKALARHLWRQELARRARGPPLLQSVWANLHSGDGNAILGPDWEHLHGCLESW